MIMCYMEALILIIYKLLPMSISLNNWSNVKVKSLITNRKIFSQAIFHVKNQRSSTHYQMLLRLKTIHKNFLCPNKRQSSMLCFIAFIIQINKYLCSHEACKPCNREGYTILGEYMEYSCEISKL